jgi:protein-S-isoprenylcysteine O-methyltransferase Ste14
MTASRIPNPGVRFPPPFLFAAGILVGWLANRAYPLALLPRAARGLGLGVGYLLVACSTVLGFSAISRFWRARTPLLPHKPAIELVTTGPYRLTRNPMYLSLTLLYLGLVLLLNRWWPLLVLPLVLLLLQRLVIAREERYLASAFGAAYDAYCARVRRWL